MNSFVSGAPRDSPVNRSLTIIIIFCIQDTLSSRVLGLDRVRVRAKVSCIQNNFNNHNKS